MKVTAARAAGSALQKYFANLLNVSGQAGNLATRELLKAGTGTFAPNVAQSALNPFLRSGAANITPKIGSASSGRGSALKAAKYQKNICNNNGIFLKNST